MPTDKPTDVDLGSLLFWHGIGQRLDHAEKHITEAKTDLRGVLEALVEKAAPTIENAQLKLNVLKHLIVAYDDILAAIKSAEGKDDAERYLQTLR